MKLFKYFKDLKHSILLLFIICLGSFSNLQGQNPTPNYYKCLNKVSGSWNFGPSTFEIATVEEVADSIVNYFNKGSVVNEGNIGQPHEAGLLQLNCDKAHQKLKWQPTWGLKKTFEVTADWYKRVLEGERAAIVTQEQIYEFFGGGK